MCGEKRLHGRPVDGRTRRDHRALTPVLGLIVLLGVAAVASLLLLSVAFDEVSSQTDAAQDEHVERGFQTLGHDAATVGLSSADARTTDLSLGEATARHERETGAITVTLSDSDTPVVDRTLDSIEYSGGETTIAYQGGGVWRDRGAESRAIVGPPFGFDDRTLRFDVLDVHADRARSGDHFAFTMEETTTPVDGSFVDGNVVTITIESEFYGGWAEYFRNDVLEADLSVDHDAETVTVTLGTPHRGGTFSEGIIVEGDFQSLSPNACIDGPHTISGSVVEDRCGTHGPGGETIDLEPLDDLIDLAVDRARENGTSLDPATTAPIDEEGTYFVDGDLHRTSDLVVGPVDGTVTLVVDGHVTLDNAAFELRGEDSRLQVITTGDVAIVSGQGGTAVPDDDPTRVALFGTSTMQFGLGQTGGPQQGDFTGGVFAPRTEPANRDNEAAETVPQADNCHDVSGESPDVCIGQGNVDVVGTVVSGSMSIEQDSEIRHDPAVDDVRMDLADPALPTPLTTMHLGVHEIDVDVE